MGHTLSLERFRSRSPIRGYASSSGGFTLIETLVAGLVLVVGLIAIAQFFASAASRITESDVRSLLMQVANREIEDIRALPYEDVGTTDGNPLGVLSPTATRDEDGVQVQITREVIYVTDSSYSGPYPANYRRVTVTASSSQHPELAPVVVSSFVAGGAPGGTLDILVTRANGDPIPDAQITVTNTHLSPNVNISSSAMRTDSNGRLVIPGLTPDATQSYHVIASKSGYNPDWTDPDVVVNDGVPYTSVTLILEPLSSLVIHLIDPAAMPIAGKILTITGPWNFNQQGTTVEDGTLTFSNIPYSPSANLYNVALESGQGYEPASQNVDLPSGTTLHVDLVANPLTTTTTDPASTTTTVSPSSTTTTTAPLGSLLVIVRSTDWWGWDHNQSGAFVKLGDYPEQRTNDRGRTTFSDLPLGTYPLVVRKTGFDEYIGEVTITGDNAPEIIYITRK